MKIKIVYALGNIKGNIKQIKMIKLLLIIKGKLWNKSIFR